MGRNAATLRRSSRVIAGLAVVVPAALAFTGTVEGWPLPALLFGGLATAGGLGLWANWHLGTAHHDRLGHVALGRGLQLREPPDPGRGTRAGAFTLQAHRAHRRNRGLPPDHTERPDPELLDGVLPPGTRWCGLLAARTGGDAFDVAHQVRADDAGAQLLTPVVAARWERTVGHARLSLRDGWLGLAHETRDPAQTEAAARSLLEAVEVLADELGRRGS